jgi:pimeloyl-ACP methyl ester carboxylesterase
MTLSMLGCNMGHPPTSDNRRANQTHSRSRRRFLVGSAATFALPAISRGAIASDGGQESGPDAHDVAARDGLQLRLWERSPPDAEEAVLFVHGATYGGRSMFDPPVPQEYETWLRYAANRGQAAFAVDIRGYGESERPEFAMHNGEPPIRAMTAACDVADALAWVHERFDRVHLVGVSWGTMIAGTLFSNHDPEVASLVQQAPVYDLSPELREAFDHDGTPYRTVTKSQIKERWNAQIPDDEDPAVFRRADSDDIDFVLDAVWKALYDSGQYAAEGKILAPNGTLEDIQQSPVYDAVDITVPTLVARSSYDTTSTRKDAFALYDALTIPEGRAEYTEFDSATHMIHLERRRHALYNAVYDFQNRAL